jgi:hypothetical protein
VTAARVEPVATVSTVSTVERVATAVTIKPVARIATLGPPLGASDSGV